MTPHRLEVADVVRKHGDAYLAQNGSSPDQKRVLRDVGACRTAVLGGHVKRCDHCGHEEFFYKSCGNRHCPKCQGAATAKWLEARTADLLETNYFHIVFTLPHKLGPIALQNKRIVYGILFRAVSETLIEIARDQKHLGAEGDWLLWNPPYLESKPTSPRPHGNVNRKGKRVTGEKESALPESCRSLGSPFSWRSCRCRSLLLVFGLGLPPLLGSNWRVGGSHGHSSAACNGA